MSKSLLIQDLQVFQFESLAAKINGLYSIFNYIEKYKHETKKIYFISSTELLFLRDKDVILLLKKIHHKFLQIKISILSLGCTGFYASLLDFYFSKETSAIVCVIETPLSELQHTLNSLGIGIDPGQDGLVSQEGIGLCRLNKQIDISSNQRCFWVRAVKIMGLPNTIDSTIVLIKKFVKYLSEISHKNISEFVSFQIQSTWSEALIRGLNTLKEDLIDVNSWLPSIEQSYYHTHGLKPLLELQKYQEKTNDRYLIISCLGAAGRIGVMQVSLKKPINTIFTKSEKLVVKNFTLLSNQNKFDVLEQHVNNYRKINRENVRNFFYYMKKEYSDLDNFYFEWIL